jgi:predicted nucleotidyltransferase
MKETSLETLIHENFSQQPGIIAVLLYGSQVEGNITPESDIDLAVLYDYSFIPTPMELWEMKEWVAESLRCPVDLICLNTADTIIASQVLKNHRVLLLTNPKKLSEYFVRICVDYAELKELRKPMEDSILERRQNA